MVILKRHIPRRIFLRGAGVGFALPMLDAMTPAFAVETKRPIRMAFMEVPNGIFNLNNEWTPKTEGTDWEMTQTLKPLEAFRDRMVVISGLDNQQAAGHDGEVGGDHPRACTAFLTGTHAKMTSGADLHAGISVDQIAAKEFGKETQLASLEIGLESSEIVGACESAYGCAYYDTISWRNESTPLPMENRPRAVFERLFGDGGTDPKVRLAIRSEDKSILDAVNADIKRLRGRVAGPDRARVVQSSNATREFERRIRLAEKQDIHALPIGSPVGAPAAFTDYFKLMADLMVLSWQTDMTRVITFQMGHEMSGRAYPELGFGDAHHPCTHHQGDREKQIKETQINGLHTKMLAYYIGKLRDTKDGDSSLLEHSMVLYGGGLSDANLHLYTDLSLLLVAGNVTGIKGGTHVRYPKRTPMANLHLALLAKPNEPYSGKLGDSTGKLELPMGGKTTVARI